jgi:hypothetical protein
LKRKARRLLAVGRGRGDHTGEEHAEKVPGPPRESAAPGAHKHQARLTEH